MTINKPAPRVFDILAANPSSPFLPAGTLMLRGPYTFNSASQYPGADKHVRCPAQVVALETNGYYVQARLHGTIVGRGHYGGPINVPDTHLFQLYAYEADWMIAPKRQQPNFLEHLSRYIDLDPRTIGGVYRSGYWHKDYVVDDVRREDGSLWFTETDVDDQRQRSHCTPWDRERDTVVSVPYARDAQRVDA